jgi:hypothetical protein
MSNEKLLIVIWSACRNSEGYPDIIQTDVRCTQDEIDDGDHYEMAEEALIEDNYEGPFVHFDHMETGAILEAAKEIKAHAARTPEEIAAHEAEYDDENE